MLAPMLSLKSENASGDEVDDDDDDEEEPVLEALGMADAPVTRKLTAGW